MTPVCREQLRQIKKVTEINKCNCTRNSVVTPRTKMQVYVRSYFHQKSEGDSAGVNGTTEEQMDDFRIRDAEEKSVPATYTAWASISTYDGLQIQHDATVSANSQPSLHHTRSSVAK